MARLVRTRFRMKNILSALFAIGCIGFATATHASITPVGPFSGSASESFESFSSYYSTGYQANGSAVFGGLATMWAANSDLTITPSGGFGLYSASAQAADGAQFLGLNSEKDSVTFAFTSAIDSFGGYFGAAFGGPYSGWVNFGFSDGSSAAYAYSNSSGNLDWQGWSFSSAINSVTISGDYIVMDKLQANGSRSVPDGGLTLAMTGCTLVLLAGVRRKFFV